MRKYTISKVEAVALMIGPILALGFFLLEPGGLLIDSAESTDHLGKVTAFAENSTLAHVVALVVPFGLVLTVDAAAGLWRVFDKNDLIDGVARLGSVSLIIGGVGWIMVQGLAHVMANTDLGSESEVSVALSLSSIDSGVTLISSLAVSLGLIAFTAGVALEDQPGVHRIIALVITAVSFVSIVALIIGHTQADETMVAIGRACYFPWVFWMVLLGARLLKPDTAAAEEARA